jgi:hypothetical protein
MSKTSKRDWASEFRAISAGKSASFGAELGGTVDVPMGPTDPTTPWEERDYQGRVDPRPDGATRRPDYDPFGWDLGSFFPQFMRPSNRTARKAGLISPTSVFAPGVKRTGVGRAKSAHHGDLGPDDAHGSSSEINEGLADAGISGDEFCGEPEKKGLPTWVLAVLGILGIAIGAEVLSSKLPRTPHSHRLGY